MKKVIVAVIAAALLSSCTIYEVETVRRMPSPEADVEITDDGWSEEQSDSVEHGF